jgi:uncharacterized protein YqcC (DUF446 family)
MPRHWSQWISLPYLRQILSDYLAYPNVGVGDEQAALGRWAGDHPREDWGWPPMRTDAI